MPWGLKRFQQTGDLHFINFTCHHRAPLLGTPQARDVFELTLERVRRWYGFYIVGYVVMPEHVHLLMSEPERGSLAVAIQMLKQISSRKLRTENPHPSQSARTGPPEKPHPPHKTRKGGPPTPFWERRYYDFNLWSASKYTEKLDYMHMNPVKRGLVKHPEEWPWSSFRHWKSGVEGRVEIESPWTARKRERMSQTPKLIRREN